MKQKILYTIGIFAMAVYFIGLYTESHLLLMISKPIPILAMMALLKPGTSYNRYIFTGLTFSLIGDMLLETSSTLFIYGLIAFLITHIIYLTAFLKRNHQIALVPLLLLSGYSIALYWLLFQGLNDMAIPVLIYTIAILLMCWRAIAQRNFDSYAVYAAAGAIFFLISDSFIAINKFYVEIPDTKWLIMITYWIAQALIFYSAYKSDDEQQANPILE